MNSFVAIIDSFINYAELNEDKKILIKAELRRYITNHFAHGKYVHPMITKFATDWYNEFYRLVDYQDPYSKLKQESNQRALQVIGNIKINSFQDMLKVAIKGNQIDYGAVLVLNYDLSKIGEDVSNLEDFNLDIDDSAELLESIGKAKKVLFLADNDGEIIFDTFLIKMISEKVGKENLFIVGKETPMLNDVTKKDLEMLGFDEYGKIVSTGSNCFGLHEEYVSNELKSLLKEADLIIAKGQAYLEFFTEYNFPNVFNIAYIKHHITDSALGILKTHNKVVISSKRYASKGKPYDFSGLNPKFVKRTDIRALAERLRRQGKKIVTTNGAFDILHVGHIKSLQEAKKQGDVLIVGLNSDSSIKKYKSPLRPINGQEDRAAVLSALDCVDYVFIFDETVPMPFLEDVKPNVHVKSSEYGEKCIEAETVKKNGGRIHIVDVVEGYSTTKLIEKIIESKKKEIESKEIITVIENQKGILFANPAIVHRETYSGRDIVAKNSEFKQGYVDERGYVPVEWWIMSITQAENDKKKDLEGLTEIFVDGKPVLLRDVIESVPALRTFKSRWPLTKVLDIGGVPVKPSFSEDREVPPIPAHLHSGIVNNGKMCPPGKLEAYFLPPVNVSPYNKDFGKVITRLGIRPDVTKEQFEEALKQFGKSDDVYSLCNTYEIKPYDGWTIPAGALHAPGPWTTFEIQLPQDDFNLAAWQLGKRFTAEELPRKRQELLLKGLKDESDFVEQAIDWKISTNPEFKKNHYRPSQVIEQGPWGRRLQIFFDRFYGEGFEINPGEIFIRKADESPYSGIVWSGKGTINGNQVNVDIKEQKEFLVMPGNSVDIKNTGNEPLLIYTVFPIKPQ